MSKTPATSKAAAKPAAKPTPEKVSPQEALAVIETWLRERGALPAADTQECNDASQALVTLQHTLATAAQPVVNGQRDVERRVKRIIHYQEAGMEELLKLLGYLAFEDLPPAIRLHKINDARQRLLRNGEHTWRDGRYRLSPLLTIAVAHLFHRTNGWLPDEGYTSIADFMADVAVTALRAQREDDDE